MRKFLNILSGETNIFVAFGVYSLVMLTSILYNIEVDTFANFAFFASMNVYSFSIIYSKYRFNRSFLFTGEKLLHKIIFSITSVILPFYIVNFSFELILLLLPIALVSFLYPVGVKEDSNSFLALRELPYLKIFLISVSWALVTLILPLVYAENEINFNVFVEFVFRVAFVMAITLPFDIRDVKSDKNEMKTLPQIMGVKKAKLLSYILILSNILYYFFRPGDYSFFLVLIVFLLLIFLVSKSNTQKDLYFFNVLIESSSILLFISVLY